MLCTSLVNLWFALSPPHTFYGWNRRRNRVRSQGQSRFAAYPKKILAVKKLLPQIGAEALRSTLDGEFGSGDKKLEKGVGPFLLIRVAHLVDSAFG